MLFKEKPWSILEAHPNILTANKGIYGLFVYDPFLEKIYQSKISHFVKESLKINYQVILGKELNYNWVEENLLTPNLFSNESCYFVLNSEEISESLWQKVLENYLNFSNDYLVFSFSKNSTFFKKLSQQAGNCISVESLPFWESDKLLEFLIKEARIQLPLEIKRYLLANTENDPGSFINSLKLIKITFGKKIPNLEDVSKLIPQNKIDFFQMASLYSKKNKKEVLEKLLEIETENFNWHHFISSMVGHLIKLLDPSGLSPNKSNYEREILASSKLWTKEELIKEIILFGDLQTEAKTKKNLKEKLRLYLLENI